MIDYQNLIQNALLGVVRDILKQVEENGLNGFSNVILMGKIIKETGLFVYDDFVNYLVGSIPPAKEALIEKNKTALELGYNA